MHLRGCQQNICFLFQTRAIEQANMDKTDSRQTVIFIFIRFLKNLIVKVKSTITSSIQDNIYEGLMLVLYFIII